MVGQASSSTSSTHRWDSRASVKGQASVARSAKQTKSPAWRGAATGRDPNALNGPPHAVAQATHRLLDVYDTCLRDVDECLGVPRDEWAPPLGYDVGETTFRGAPRLWPAEANHPSGYAKGADAPSALNGASFRRETTVSSLMSVTTLRGSRRAEARASRRGARMATVAGEIRRVQAARHVDWVKGEPPKPRGLARATLDRGRLLGVAAAPHSTYRRVLRATGSGAPPKTSRPKRCGSYTVLTNPDAKRPPEDAVADAVVTHVARDRRRYALRLSGAAACSQQLRSSRSPGASAIFDLHTLWRASASENPDPSVIARTQFVTAFRARLSGGPRRAADALYSSLDPRLADRCRVGAATASLLFAHPVWPVDGRDADYSQDERDVLSAVRAAAECYDYDGRGLSSDEISELLDTPCVDREASDRLAALVGSHAVWTSTIEQASRRWCGGRSDESARTRWKMLIFTQVSRTGPPAALAGQALQSPPRARRLGARRPRGAARLRGRAQGAARVAGGARGVQRAVQGRGQRARGHAAGEAREVPLSNTQCLVLTHTQSQRGSSTVTQPRAMSYFKSARVPPSSRNSFAVVAAM